MVNATVQWMQINAARRVKWGQCTCALGQLLEWSAHILHDVRHHVVRCTHCHPALSAGDVAPREGAAVARDGAVVALGMPASVVVDGSKHNLRPHVRYCYERQAGASLPWTVD
jgi:hypothetical protein